MTSVQPPVITFPFPRPFEPAPEMLAPGRLPGLRLAVGFGELRYKEKVTITSVRELPVTWEPQARPGPGPGGRSA
jgi:hypothetical protein